MKTKHSPSALDFRAVWGAPSLIFLTALFVCGAVAGSFAGRMAAVGGVDLISELAASLRTGALTPPTARDALYAALGAGGWQLAAVAAGRLRPASLFLSLVCMARGFTLSFSVSAMLHALGTAGLWRSLTASGAAAVITVPCLLLTASACFTAAQDSPKGGYFYALTRFRALILRCTLLTAWIGALQPPLTWILQTAVTR